MPRRLPQTLADYVVVAIAPTLIALMVGALLFFLVELLYPPEWHPRLRWIYGWYVIAIVGIARISLEQGWPYASSFAAALSVAVALVVPPESWPLLVVVGWAAYQLTRDTTLIDETQDASGEGLWETAIGEHDALATASPDKPAPRDKLAPPDEPAPHRPPPLSTSLGRLVWQRLWGQESTRPHAPGRWVIYFCLAAVPLFGLGGWLVPHPQGGDSWAMHLLVVYTACGLGLLLSTSFLGLRRYLRQRQVAMPPEMTAVWLVAGSLAIAATLLVAALLPRPSPQTSALRLAQLVALNVHRASPWGWGRQGLPDQTTPKAATTPGDADALGRPAARPNAADNASPSRETAQTTQTPKKAQSSDASETRGSSQSTQSPQASSASQSSKTSQASKTSQTSKTSQGSSTSQEPESAQKSNSSKSANSLQPPNPSQSPNNLRSSDPSQTSDGPSRGAQPRSEQGGNVRVPEHSAGSPQSTTRQRWAELPSTFFRGVGQGLATLLRWVVTLAGLGLIAFVLWTYRAELAEAWRNWLAALAALWEGGKPEPGRAEPPRGPSAPPPVPFAAFPNPFAVGTAGRMPWPELVRYSFSALEAWARERGCPRRADQTPQEFVVELVRRHDLPGEPLKLLAGWYSELAYGPRLAQRVRPLAPLQTLWRALEELHRSPTTAG